MLLPRRPKIPLVIAALAITNLLMGCGKGFQPRNTLFIAYGIDEVNFSKATKTRIEGRIAEFTENFKRSHPEVQVVLSVYKGARIWEDIIRDSKLNLGPDLIISNEIIIKFLHQEGFAAPLPAQIDWDQTYDPLLKEIASTDGQYIAAPFLTFTQVACYNKKTVPSPPQTIQELEKLTASGTRVGLSLEPAMLLWTAGSLGAIKEISALGLNKSKSADTKAIHSWLAWLRKAAFYQNISFFKSYVRLDASLINNELDWITCRASEIEKIRNKMGDSLGVSALPNGARTAAFPWPSFISFGLGINSSPAQRDTAIKYIQSSTNVIIQRQLMLRNADFLATNKHVSIPISSSRTLQALNTSFNKQVRGYTKEWPGVIDFLSGHKNHPNRYQEVSSALADLTSGYLKVDQALDILSNFKQGSEP